MLKDQLVSEIHLVDDDIIFIFRPTLLITIFSLNLLVVQEVFRSR